MVCTELAVSIPFDEPVWMNIVDHYFDHVHWKGEERSTYNSPSDWVRQEYECDIDLTRRTFMFNCQKKANWFVLTWL